MPGPRVPQRFFVARAMAPMAGATVSQSPMVTTIDVTYPNGRMPTSPPTMPAKIICSREPEEVLHVRLPTVHRSLSRRDSATIYREVGRWLIGER